jgi:cytochrome c-type biogenesis protein CcmH/NrfF
MNSVNPQTKVGTFRVIVRPFVAWIWLGGLFMIFGTFVCMSPSVREVLGELPALRPARVAGPAVATTIVLGLFVGAAILFGASSLAHGQGLLTPSRASAQADSSSSLHAGSVTLRGPVEKQLFERLLCMCGDCQRLPLSTCSCGWADDMRAKIRDEMATGKTPDQVQAEYRDKYGAKAIAIPSDRGLDRALWAVPIAAIALAAGVLVWRGRTWVKPQPAALSPAADGGAAPAQPDSRYDAALDAELKKLDDLDR